MILFYYFIFFCNLPNFNLFKYRYRLFNLIVSLSPIFLIIFENVSDKNWIISRRTYVIIINF